MVMPGMLGGGAERVAAQLLNEFQRNGCKCEFLLTSMSAENAVNTDLDKSIPLTSLKDNKFRVSAITKVFYAVLFLYATVFCKLFEKAHKNVPAHFAYVSFVSQHYKEIRQLRQYLKNNPDATIITFLQPTIPLVLLASRGLPNKVIFSERGDPKRLMKHRYGEKFIRKYYNRANAVVFQTEDAKNTYPENISKKGVVISNPIKSDLPEAYHGERNKNITTFCRISAQKNLPILLEAFNKLQKEHPGYTLRIIGDVLNDEGKAVEKQMKSYIEENNLTASVVFEPFNANVHQTVIKDAMYVNSSDYEGISNAMLEAMAIGMPVVCTDCPIGGARATIKDGENGLLVSVGDADAIYLAMKKVIEDDKFAKRLSLGAEKIRDELSLEKIAKKWMGLL